MSDRRYEHFSRGDLVELAPHARIAPYNQALDEDGAGIVRNVTNAGFRGLEYHIETVEGRQVYGVSAADLGLLEAVDPVRPWPGQGSYRNGRQVNLPPKPKSPEALANRF